MSSAPPSTNRVCIGVDGCRGGWIAVIGGSESAIEMRVFDSFAELLSTAPSDAVIAIDIPIGLVERGHRACDTLARQLLGPVRGASVFPAPIRPVLGATSHTEASRRRREVESKGMSLQAFAITAKVAEVDAVLRADSAGAARVFEVHPEISFREMNRGEPLLISKKRAAGRQIRADLLSREFGSTPQGLIRSRNCRAVAADDVLDALVALSSAKRIAQGCADCLPGVPERDTSGLVMAIYY